jgi:hypothetical protein
MHFSANPPRARLVRELRITGAGLASIMNYELREQGLPQLRITEERINGQWLLDCFAASGSQL